MRPIRALIPAALLAAAILAAPAAAEQDTLCLTTTGTVSGLQHTQEAIAALKALATSNSGASEPANDCSEAPLDGQVWLDTSVTPSVWKIFDGDEWLTVGSLDDSGHVWVPPVGGGASSVASASTTSLWSVPEAFVTISGNTGITSFGSGGATGSIKFVRFSGAPTITHNGTSLILPGGANIAAVAGDRAIVASLGGANSIVVAYTRADGSPLVANSTFVDQTVFAGIITPPALSATTNNWAPSGLGTANTIRASATTSQTVTGLAAQAAGTEITILNVNASTTITLADESGSSSAGNRFNLGADYLIGPSASATLRYDGTLSRWMLSATARNQATQSQALAGSDNTTTMTPLRTNQLLDQDIATATSSINGTISSGDAATLSSAQSYVLQGYRFLSQQVFTSSGTWSRPSGARLIRVRGCGSGGGGGGADADDGDATAAGAGGSAGQCGEFTASVTSISSLSIGIGSPGNGGSTSGGNGGGGGDVTVGSLGTFAGGNGGAGASSSVQASGDGPSGGSGGSVPGGGLLMTGGDGAAGLAVISRTGDQNVALSGHGGASWFGDGGRSRSQSNNGTRNGDAGAAPGSGGSGGVAVNETSGASGGAGRAGIVIIESYI